MSVKSTSKCYTVHRGHCVLVGADMQVKAQCRSGVRDAARVYVNAAEGYSEHDTKPSTVVDLGGYGNVTARGLNDGKVMLRFTCPETVRVGLSRDGEPIETVLAGWQEAGCG